MVKTNLFSLFETKLTQARPIIYDIKARQKSAIVTTFIKKRT